MIEGATIDRTVTLAGTEVPVYASIPAELEGMHHVVVHEWRPGSRELVLTPMSDEHVAEYRLEKRRERDRERSRLRYRGSA